MSSETAFKAWRRLLGAWVALAMVGAASASDATAIEPGAVEQARRQANAFRRAIERGDASLDGVRTRAYAALEALPSSHDARREIELHLLRSRMRTLPAGRGGAEETSVADASDERDERRAVRRGLESLATRAEEANDVGVNTYALVYLAELDRAAGREETSLERARRALRSSETADTWRAHVAAHALIADIVAGETGADDARDSLDRALVAGRRATRLLARHRDATPAAAFFAMARPIHERLAERLIARSGFEEAARREPWLREAIEVIEELKVAELRDYFGDPCLVSLASTTPELLPDTLLLYPVLGRERAHLIVGRAGRLEGIELPVDSKTLVAAGRRLQLALRDPTTPRYRKAAAKLYEALIRPLGDEALDGERTLVFVPPASLRGVPLAALYDDANERFLIERTPVATLVTLRLPAPRPLDLQRTRMLLLGLTESVEGFPALPEVAREVASAAQHFRSRQILDGDFSVDALERALTAEAYDIVHIASHGQFDAKASESFLLTHDGRLSLPDFARLIERTRHHADNPIELLTMSACETAKGDDRALLGLAGVAVQSGARSAVATLWQVQDRATAQLIDRFYAALAVPGTSRAQAMRTAQLALLADVRFRHPVYWSPFLLLNAWR